MRKVTIVIMTLLLLALFVYYDYGIPHVVGNPGPCINLNMYIKSVYWRIPINDE